LTEKVFERLQHHHLSAKTITLKIKFADFRQITRCTTHSEAFSDADQMLTLLSSLLELSLTDQPAVRLIGVTASGFDHGPQITPQKTGSKPRQLPLHLEN